MEFNRTVERAGDGCWISVRSRDWDRPANFSQRSKYNHLSLRLPPINYQGRVRFPEAGSGATHRVGRSYFYPAGYLMEGWGTGGHAQWMRFIFSQRRAIQTLEVDEPWKPDQIERGCDLEHSGVFPLLVRMAAEVRAPGLGHGVLMEALFNQAIIELARFLGQAVPDLPASGRLTTVQLGRIEQRVRAEDLQPPSVTELAAMSGMSERHLLRLFQATTGNSVSSFIRGELIARARRLLSQGDLPLKQIAFVLGFSGPSSFSLAFRKATGMTPARYRSMNFSSPVGLIGVETAAAFDQAASSSFESW